MTDIVEPETVKITSEKPVKIKDPKRVAQGKKLAAISKAAKERKMREKIEMEMQGDIGEGTVPWGYVIGGVGICAAVGALCYGYFPKDKIWNPPETVREVKKPETVREVKRGAGYETFD